MDNTKNWIKCSQSLIIMKEALHEYIDNEVTNLHCDISKNVSSMFLSGSTTGNQCGSCLSKNIKLKRGIWYINCSSNICDKWIHHILAVHNEPHNPTICWKNVDISKWPTERYHVAKVFMPKGQDRAKTMPMDLDAPAILSLLKYCSWFSKHLPNTQILSDLIDIRNKVLHSGDMRVVDNDKDSWIDLMIELLRDLNISGDAQVELQMLKTEDIDINFRETEIRVLQHMVSVLQTSRANLLEEMKTLRENLTETTGKVDTAKTDIEGIRKALEELKNTSDKLVYFLGENQDIPEQTITENIRNIGIDVQELQSNLITVEIVLKTKLFALEKLQKETKQQLEETKHHLERRIVALEEQKENNELSLQKGQLEQSRQWDHLRSDNQQVSMAEMRRRIDHSKEVLKKHRYHADKFFFENQRYKTGKKILDLHRKIFIIGKAGQGKTYLAYQLLSKLLEDKTHVSPLIISSADEWMKLAAPSTELGIVVDDMCGKYGLLQGELKKWNENVRFITALIDNGQHTVIFTMRTHIHEETAKGIQLESDISDPLFEKNIILNLDGGNMALNEEDKIEFANRYLQEYSLTNEEVLQLCRKNETAIGFPLLCRKAQSIQGKSELFDMFDRPLQIMLRELDCLRKDKSLIYGCLVLTMLLGGTLPLESINEYPATIAMKNLIKLVFDSFAGPNVKLAEIQQAAKTLCGTYLMFNESEESYSFFHNTVEEAVFLSYGKLYLQETLKLCSLRSLCKLCRINNGYQDLNVSEATLMLDLRPKDHGILIERFVKALEKKCPRDFATIAEANVWSSNQFRNLFMDGCKTIHVLEDMDENTLLVHAANANNCDLAGELLRDMKQSCAETQHQSVSFLTKAAKASCIHKDLCLLKQIIKTGIVNVNDILSVTVEKGSLEAMESLLQNGADINYRSKNGESLLHAACLHGRLNMIEFLLSKTPLTLNICDSRGRSVCHSAASGGRVDILEFLIKRGANPLCTDIGGMNLLQYACLEGKTEMAFYLMEKYSIMLCTEKDGFTVLHCAAFGGSIDIFNKVCELINTPSQTYYISQSEETELHHEKLANPNERITPEETLLHIACLSGKLEMTKYLVEKYPDMINEVNKQHNASTTLYAATAIGGNVSVLQYLIDKGLNVWSRTARQGTLIHVSCVMGQLEMTEYLLAKYPNMINEVDYNNETPAHYAARGGKVTILQYLIDKGLDPWCRTATQKTLLHMSCMFGQLEMTKYLIEKYPNMINEVDSVKGTPAQYAASGGSVSVLQYLTDKGMNPWCRTATQKTFLHMSCMFGQLEMTKYLIEKYPNMINEVDYVKGTPGHYAASGGSVSVLQYLIDKGLNPWCRTATQETLLHVSCIMAQLEITEYLLEKYPNMINEVDDNNETPAHSAARGGKVTILQYLIDKGLDPLCRTVTQETLLHKSCLFGQLEMTQHLIKKYPNMINEADSDKGTPAHHAAMGGNVSVLQCLIDQGLNPLCRTVTQETLLHKSCHFGQLEMTQHLIKKYPNMINEADSDKGTPAHHAAMGGNVSVLQYLIDKGLNPWC